MNYTKPSLLVAILLTVTLANAGGVHSDGGEVLRAMHDRYANSWYKTLTFVQKSTTYNADGTTKVETWYEAALLPAKLRIDIGPPSDGNGYLMVDGTATIFREGKTAATRPLVNMLLVLGFDVYRQPAETTAQVAKNEGFDLSKVHMDTWEGKPVFVVGADRGDLQSKQFWIEKDSLLFVRIFEPTQADPKKMQDIRFTDYRPLAGGWVAARVEVHVDDKMVFSEEYSDIQANVTLDPALFDPAKYSAVRWETTN